MNGLRDMHKSKVLIEIAQSLTQSNSMSSFVHRFVSSFLPENLLFTDIGQKNKQTKNE